MKIREHHKRGTPQCKPPVWTVETEWALMAVVAICAAIIVALRVSGC